MKMKINLSLLIIFISALSACQNKNKIDITGKWESAYVEKTGNGSFSKREFFIGDTSWEVKYTLYLDSAATQPVFTFRGIGSYILGIPSVKVEGATEVVFSFSNKYIKLHTADTLLHKKFGFTPCVLSAEKEKEITETGCSFFVSKSVCAQEYDLVSIKEEKLYLGARPPAGSNICNQGNRPTELGLPLKKIGNNNSWQAVRRTCLFQSCFC